MEDVRIAKGGRLLTTKRIDTEEDEERREAVFDITQHAPSFLFCNCTVDSDVVLRDIFLLLEKHLKAFTDIFNDNLTALVREGLSPYPGEKPSQETLLLSWNLTVEDDLTEKTLYGNGFPDFLSFHSTEDELFALDFTPSNGIAELPIRLSSKLWIRKGGRGKDEAFENPQYTLGQILIGIVDELLSHGSPEDRNKELAEHKRVIKETKNEGD
jgi:hypothetical protein